MRTAMRKVAQGVRVGKGVVEAGGVRFVRAARTERDRAEREDCRQAAGVGRGRAVRDLSSPLAAGDELLAAKEAVLVIAGPRADRSMIYRLADRDVRVSGGTGATVRGPETVFTVSGKRWRKLDCERFAVEYHRAAKAAAEAVRAQAAAAGEAGGAAGLGEQLDVTG